MTFVAGKMIEPSNTNHEPDICDDLKGRYPKNFKWTGWHPHCRCHAITLLKTQKEMAEDNRRIMAVEEPTNYCKPEAILRHDTSKGSGAQEQRNRCSACHKEQDRTSDK